MKAIVDALKMFGIIFLGSFFLIAAFSYDELSQPGPLYRVVMGAVASGLMWVGNSMSVRYVSKRYSWLDAPVKRFFLSLFATLIITFVIWYFIASLWYVPEKGADFTWPARNFRWGYFLPSLFIALFISIFMHGRGFLLSWRDVTVEAERLKKEQVEARYEALKNQVNPHFLFNSLNVLTTLVHKDPDQAELFIRRLSAVYRYVLDSRDREVVSLDEELKALEAFVFLMKTRFGDSFEARIDVADRHGRVAPLTLQMLVENALKHNEVSKSHPLAIEVFQQNGHVVVRNNVQTKTSVGESSGVGLENIRGRYQFLSDKPIEVSHNDEHFTVKVPIV